MCAEQRLGSADPRSPIRVVQADQSQRRARTVAKDPKRVQSDSEDWSDCADAQADLSSLDAHAILQEMLCPAHM